MAIGEVSGTIKDRVEIRGSFLTVTVNKLSGNYKIVGIVVCFLITSSDSPHQAPIRGLGACLMRPRRAAPGLSLAE